MPNDLSSDLLIAPEAPADADAVMALVDRVFGPGRYAKSAERLREGNHHLAELSFVAREAGALLGSVRLWPVRVGAAPALLLGPIAVDPAARRRGLGVALAARACDAAAGHGHARIVLVGDLSFFERIGFTVSAPGCIRLPGPADPRRVLIRALAAGAWEGVEGDVTLP